MKTISRVVLTVAGLSVLATGWRAGEEPFAAAQVQAVAAPAAESSAVGAGASSAATGATDSSQTASAAPTEAAQPSAATAVTYVGPAMVTRYGTMQVQLVVEAGVVTDIQTLQEGLTDSKSQRINANAIPTLISEVLDAQTSNVSYVSGASYTSQGILGSIEAALADAGLA
ncbi:FMN-binding protein [Demequina aurantiaca]|uniref:FMN-binding protein n=1 Tax=Demequina aurantiaca TaxID=676200 RepID=UPI003D33E404